MRKLIMTTIIVAPAAVLLFVPRAQAEVPEYVTASCKFPTGYKIGANTPPQLHQFTGIYTGKMEDPNGPGMLHTRIVTDIDANGKAVGFYVIDDYPAWRLKRQCWEVVSKFKDGFMTRTSSRGTIFEYRFDGNNLNFTRTSSRFVNKALLTKQPVPQEWK